MTATPATAPELFTLRPIAFVRGGRAEPTDDGWDAVAATIELTPEFGAEALAGLDGFSHVEVVFLFHRVAETAVVVGARHPRGRADWPKVGIFAQRGKDRPNRLGVSVCRLVAVEGTTLRVAGLDAIDGTPVLDLKPVMRGFLPRGDLREPAWAGELMRGYWD
jgi:tRNA-Thr(GGU) m(6)t(6)A37 methyltransferase TsaA